MRRNNDSDLVDTISNLPDSILGLILSFLPTKEAVSTSVLSKRWKLVWVTVHNLDFNHVGCWKEHNEDENMKFVRFVNRVLLLNDVGLLNKFSLVWHPWCISSHCSSWINTAIARNVRHLSLSGQFDLPISVFSWDSLRSLELKGRIYVPDTFVVCLPRLESLELDGVDFQSEEAFEKLVNGCSVLNYLCLDIYNNDDDGFTYTISSTSLRRFELCFKHKCSVDLELASSLEYLKVFCCISETFVQANLNSLVGVYFSIHLLRDEFFQDDICDSIVEGVRAFDHGKALNLSVDVMRPISRFHPGRVFNMLRRQGLRPDNFRMFVLNEAVVSRAFEDQIYDFLQLLPPKIQVVLFTATMPPEAREIARNFMNKPVSMLVKRDELTLDGIQQFFITSIQESMKLESLYCFYEDLALTRSVIFVNTRRKLDWLANEMRGHGYTVLAIHGDFDQNTRDIIRREFRSGSYPVLITTNNLFARGIDEHQVSTVINYDLPTQPEKYLHRVGLSERFGRKGIAISFVTRDEEWMAFEIQKFYNADITYL